MFFEIIDGFEVTAMKLGELIKRLQEVEKKEGDLDVSFLAYGSTNPYEIETIAVHQEIKDGDLTKDERMMLKPSQVEVDDFATNSHYSIATFSPIIEKKLLIRGYTNAN